MIGRAAILAAAVLVKWASPAVAEWPTYLFAPFPPQSEGTYDFIGDGLGDYVAGSEFTLLGDGLDDGIFDVDSLDFAEMRAGAPGSLREIMRLGSIDASKMAAAGLPVPVLVPTIRENDTGSLYYPVFWASGLNGAPMRYGCVGARRYIEVEQAGRQSFQDLESVHAGGGNRSWRMLLYMSKTLSHEVVHASQNRGFGDDCRGNPGKWLSEGTADGISAYLASLREPNVFNILPEFQNVRRYDVALDGKATGESWTANEYGAGSFFRYLIEASGGMEIMVPILKMPARSAESSMPAYREIEKAIKKFSGGRGLYEVLPAFHTEYASYGGRRYTKMGGGGQLSSQFWIERSFFRCVEFDITPGVSRMKSIDVRALSAECIKVNWSGFQTPVGLQIFVQDAKKDQGSLHLGEAVWKDGRVHRHCYDATKSRKNRIAAKWKDLCILKRGAQKTTGSGGTYKALVWNSGDNLTGSGHAYYILSNVAKDFEKTKDVKVKLLVGAVDLKKANGAPVKPKTQSVKPVAKGMTDIDSRVNSVSTVVGGNVLDGRVIDKDHAAWVPGSVKEVAPPGGGAMTLVRAEDYWVGFFGNGRRRPIDGDAAVIIKDPERLQNMTSMGGMNAPIMSAGMMGVDINKCGFDASAGIRILEDTDETLKVRVTGDLFDMRRAFGRGEMNLCTGLREAHVERADFVVTLPFGALYSGESSNDVSQPPGQEVYDQDFQPGANYGGIAASLASASDGVEDEGDEPNEAPDIQPSQNGESFPVSDECACNCPSTATPGTSACLAQCQPILAAQCTGGSPASALKFSQLLDQSDLPAQVRDLLIEDFERMSAGTQARILELSGGSNAQ